MEDEGIEARLERRQAWRDYVRRLSRAHREDKPGYAGMEVHEETREVLVFGVSKPSDELVAVMSASPPGVVVEWHETRWTLAEVLEEMDRIWSEQPQDRFNSGSANRAGICFVTEDPELLAATNPTQVLGSRYPVKLEYGTPAILV